MGLNRNTEKVCACCQTPRPFAQFHPSPNRAHGKQLPYCKSCCAAKLKAYIIGTQSEEAGLWCLLAEFGIPFIEKFWVMTQKVVNEATGKGRKPDLFLTYLRIMNEQGFVVKGFWQSDMMLSAFYNKDNVKSRPEDKPEPVVNIKEQVKIWGEFKKEDGTYDMGAYEILNDTFNEYTKDLLEMDTNVIRRYRDLAKAEWRLRKANELGDGQEITRAQDGLNKQLTLLKLNNFQENSQSETEKFIDRLNWMIEETEPSEEEDRKKYRDIAGFEQSFAEIMRSMKNLLCSSREFPEIPKDEQ